MSLAGKDDYEKLQNLVKKTYKDQGIWFLNGYWHKFSAEAELVWQYVHKFQSLDLQKGAEGCEVDELTAHRFLEAYQQTQTVREMRDNLRATGAIQGNPKYFPLTHFLIFKYQINYKELVNSTQGDNQAEIEEAQNKLRAVQAAFDDSQKKAEEAKTAVALSKTKERESREKEAELKAAKQELEAALAELRAQETAYNDKTNSLRAKGEDESISVVQRNKAKNELAQHLAEDPLNLRKSKINQEAAVKKAERSALAAEKAAKDAAEAVVNSEKAKQAAEAAVEEMAAKVDEAEQFLQEVKSKPGCAAGSIFWLERELHEAKAFLPERKGGYQKKK
jgi:DNA repair exonuclease SbcCD ATPase subunit